MAGSTTKVLHQTCRTLPKWSRTQPSLMGTGPPARARCSRCLGGERIKNSCTTLRWRKPNVNSMNELLNDPPPQVVSCKHHGSTKSRNDDKPGSNWRAGEAPLKQQNTYSHTYLTAITKQSKTLLWFQILSLQKATSLITLFFSLEAQKKNTQKHQAIKPSTSQPNPNPFDFSHLGKR